MHVCMSLVASLPKVRVWAMRYAHFFLLEQLYLILLQVNTVSHVCLHVQRKQQQFSDRAKIENLGWGGEQICR